VAELPKTNADIRKWYLEQVAQVRELNEQWLAQGLSAKARAKKAWQFRHDARLKARAMMAKPEEVEDLRERDLAEYGNPDGPTFEFLVREWREAGLTGDAIYIAIIEGARRTNKGVNGSFTH
jgi:hypothetical protein